MAAEQLEEAVREEEQLEGSSIHSQAKLVSESCMHLMAHS